MVSKKILLAIVIVVVIVMVGAAYMVQSGMIKTQAKDTNSSSGGLFSFLTPPKAHSLVKTPDYNKFFTNLAKNANPTVVITKYVCPDGTHIVKKLADCKVVPTGTTVEVVGTNIYTDTNNKLHLYAVLLNNTPKTIKQPTAVLTLYDVNNNVMRILTEKVVPVADNNIFSSGTRGTVDVVVQDLNTSTVKRFIVE